MAAYSTTDRASAVQQLQVQTVPFDDESPLITYADHENPLWWSRRGNAMVGIGTALRLEFSGPTRIRDAGVAWREVVERAEVRNLVGAPGTGLVAFGAFTFSAASARSSVLIVPETIIGRRDGLTWITSIRASDSAPHETTRPERLPLGDEYRLSLLPGTLTPAGYRGIVSDALAHVGNDDLAKVVLARDLVGHLPHESDVRQALARLGTGYPDCWTYAVDGLIGSSPETLVSVNHGRLSARVLAGTSSRGPDAESDHAAAEALAASLKDVNEHSFAVRSVVDALRPHSSDLTASAAPFTLKLPNLWHLATDVSGSLNDGSDSLDLIEALHPTAAVAGSPTDAAIALIDELEPFDRGRYAGPVGWIDARGDGEWAIALRSVQVAPTGDLTAFAGAGIVAGSDPARELAETTMKFRPIVEAFG